MPRISRLLSLLLLLCLLAGCGAEPDSGPRGELPSEDSGVSLILGMGIDTPYAAEVRITNGGDCMYCFGGYTLQRKWGDFWMTESSDWPSDDPRLLTLPPGESRNLGITFWHYGLLESGWYRVVIDLVQGNDEICRQEKLLKDGTRITYYEPPEYAEHLTLAAEFYLP